jgi:hypothetical protein
VVTSDSIGSRMPPCVKSVINRKPRTSPPCFPNHGGLREQFSVMYRAPAFRQAKCSDFSPSACKPTSSFPRSSQILALARIVGDLRHFLLSNLTLLPHSVRWRFGSSNKSFSSTLFVLLFVCQLHHLTFFDDNFWHLSQVRTSPFPHLIPKFQYYTLWLEVTVITTAGKMVVINQRRTVMPITGNAAAPGHVPTVKRRLLRGVNVKATVGTRRLMGWRSVG